VVGVVGVGGTTGAAEVSPSLLELSELDASELDVSAVSDELA
jgi:hypothetical protein